MGAFWIFMNEKLSLKSISSKESYDLEDNCSGTLYLIPKHLWLQGDEVCWRSNCLVRENELSSTETNLNPIERLYRCSCGQIFKVFIKDAFGE